jgi:hypothetical protein
MRRLTAIALLAALALSGPAGRADAQQTGLAMTKITGIRVWVTIYKTNFGNIRSVVGSGWMSAGSPYPHYPMRNDDTYYIRGQVHDAADLSHVIADTTALLTKRSGAPIYLYRRAGNNFHWDY